MTIQSFTFDQNWLYPNEQTEERTVYFQFSPQGTRPINRRGGVLHRDENTQILSCRNTGRTVWTRVAPGVGIHALYSNTSYSLGPTDHYHLYLRRKKMSVIMTKPGLFLCKMQKRKPAYALAPLLIAFCIE